MSNQKIYGVGWLSFYVRFRFPVGIGLGVIMLFVNCFNGISQGYSGNAVFWALVIFDFGLLCFDFYVYQNLKQMTPKAYKLNIAALAIETAIGPLSRALGSENIAATYLFLLCFLTLVWFVPNYVYFKHRRELFTGMRTLDQIIEDEAALKKYEAEHPKKIVPKKFVCKSCGKLQTGWYQNCPACGAVGQMEEMRDDGTLKEDILQSRVISDNSGLKPDPVISVPRDRNDVQEKLITGEKMYLNTSELPPKLRRMFIFIEDEEWDRADACIETVLDEDPENPYANLGKAMVKAKVASPYSPTEEEIQILKSIKAYSRAKQYADDELKNVITSWESKATDCRDTLAQSVGIKKESGQIYLVETEDGMLIDVPSDKLDSWSKAQSERVVDEELAAREKELLDRALDTLYGDRETANKAETDSVSVKDSAAQASSLHVDEQIRRGDNNKPPKKWKDIYSILIIVFLIALATTVYVVINKQSKDSQISSSSPTGLKEYIEEKKAEETEDDRYAKALNDIKNGEISGFDEARKMALAGTISSAKYEEIVEATYQEGVKLYTDGELSQAIPFFERISTYKNSVAYLTHIYTTLERDK